MRVTVGLSEPGAPHDASRVRALGVLAVALVVFGGMLAPATPSASAALEYSNDEQGPNDEVGQTDLTRFGVDTSGLPATMVVSWSWDTIALPGANTADACALFDTDNDGRVNVSLCVTVGGSPAAQTTASPRLFGCGDDSVDRCTSPVPVASFGSTCSVSQTPTDPFPDGESSPADTTATCTIGLADVGGSNAKLANTCSYPSQVPNSDPRDCVLVPRDGFIVIDPEPAPDDPRKKVPIRLDKDPAPVFTATGTKPSDPIPVRTDPAAGTHSLKPGVPAGSRVTATCSDGSPVSAIDVDSGETVTCTISYELPDKVSVTTSTSSPNATAGSTVTISVAVTNHGPGAAGPMDVCVRPPGATTLVGRTRGARRRNGSVCWRRASLAPRKRLQGRVKVRIDSAARGRIVARVSVRSKGHRVIRRQASVRVRTRATASPVGFTG
jgi:Domain of unknown function DUF11